MGNVQDKAPQNFDTQQVHEGDFIATYRKGGDESVNIGTDNVSIGAKILMSLSPEPGHPTGDFYVMAHGKKVYLSDSGQMKPNADKVLEQADNYMAGPTIMISGTPGDVKYTVWGSTSTTESNKFQSLQVNNLDDFKKALYVGHPNFKQGKFAGNYGDLSINPFRDRPRNFISDLADLGRGLEKVADNVVIPALEWGLDDLTEGIGGTLLQITGADQILQDQLDKLTESHGLEYKSSQNQTSLQMAGAIADPRLPAYFNSLMQSSRDKVNKFPKNEYAKSLRKITTGTHTTPAEMTAAVHHLESMNLEFDSSHQITMLQKTADMLKKLVPNPPDFDWGTVTAGINAAQNPEARLRVSKYLTNALMKKVFPLVKKQPHSVPQPPKPGEKPPEKPKEPEKTAPPASNSPDINGTPKPTRGTFDIQAWLGFGPAVPAV